MARPLSSEKRNALLHSATLAVAEQGVLASTSSIARGAGVGEGTLFTYFENKGTLFQQLYLHLKLDLAQAMMPDYPHDADYQQRIQHIFDTYVNWGLANAPKRLALSRLSASGQVHDDTKEQGTAPFLMVWQMMDAGVRDGVLLDVSIAFLFAIIEQIAQTTIEFMETHPEDAVHYRQLGFHVMWKAVSI